MKINKDNAKNPKICIIMFPWPSKSVYKFLSDLLKILEPLSGRIYVISGNTNRIESHNENLILKDITVSLHYSHELRPIWFSKLLWILKTILFQVKASLELFRLSKDVNIVIFYMAYPYYLLPLVSAKILGKKTMEVITRTKTDSTSFLNRIFRLQDKIILSLIDYISPESESLISQLDLNRYKKKILPIGARFIDTDSLKIEKNINKRKKIVGYVGRVRKEKGVMNFIDAVPLITKEHKDIEFLIGGEGDLFNEIKRINDTKKYKITLPGWIPEAEFSDYLNELKLFVLPTQHAEGLPTIILEAIACGTPVLATPVGGILDVIKDGATGFIMKNNSPECIAENIVRVLERPDLDMIVENARRLIEENYTYNAAVERYREIFAGIYNRRRQERFRAGDTTCSKQV